MKRVILRVVLPILVLLLVGVGVLAWASRGLWYPGGTPRETAEILVGDLQFGMRALNRAKSCGDAILPAVKEASHDFQFLNGRNSFWIGEVLANNPSESSATTSTELYGRTNDIQRL